MFGILNVKVGEPLELSLARAAQTMEALERGEIPTHYYGIGFSDMGQLFSVFTPRRWDLLAVLRESGPMTIAALARYLKRDYKNVHGDVESFLSGSPLKNMKKIVFLHLILKLWWMFVCPRHELHDS